MDNMESKEDRDIIINKDKFTKELDKPDMKVANTRASTNPMFTAEAVLDTKDKATNNKDKDTHTDKPTLKVMDMDTDIPTDKDILSDKVKHIHTVKDKDTDSMVELTQLEFGDTFPE